MSFEVLTIYAVIVVNLLIGARLVRNGFKDSAKPELILGWALTCDATEWLLWYLSAYTAADGTSLGDALGFFCRFFIAATVCCLLWFTQAVFHTESRLARSMVALGWLGMFGALAGTAWERDWHGYNAESAWVWIEQITQNCVYAWMLVETGRYHLLLRKRLALGLTEPLVVNRVLLWFVYAAWIFSVQGLVALSVVIANQEGAYPGIIDAGMALFTVFSAIALWLAFFPPRAYENWVLSRYPAIEH
ncbi:MAG: hypothetical protein JRF15_14280 [Deltaproteobacteria bacterium]|jgi:hypothetical protein|nr:hypothetical protein [Deltaproteobacteria bacterium]